MLDPPKRYHSFCQVTPSKRQLKRGGSPSKSVIDTAKVKNKAKAVDKTKKTVAKTTSKPPAVKEVIERNSRAKRAERRVSFEVSRVEQSKSSCEHRSADRRASKRVTADKTELGERASK